MAKAFECDVCGELFKQQRELVATLDGINGTIWVVVKVKRGNENKDVCDACLEKAKDALKLLP